MNQSVHKIVYYITNILIYFYTLDLIASYNKDAALLIGFLVLMRFVATELYIYETNKKDKEIMDEIEELMEQEENFTYIKMKKKIADKYDKQDK